MIISLLIEPYKTVANYHIGNTTPNSASAAIVELCNFYNFFLLEIDMWS